jgi:transcription initiation factor TFIIE subunit alpha
LTTSAKEDVESGKNGSELKVLPPWMIKDGMNLTKEQRGEKIEPQNLEKSEAKDDKKHDWKDDQSERASSEINIYGLYSRKNT